MKRHRKITLVRVDPEVEGLRSLNSRIQRNLDALIAVHKARESVAKAENQRRRASERKYRAQVRKLIRRISYCFLLSLGVFVFWLVGWVNAPFLVLVLFLCSCVVAFALGSASSSGVLRGNHQHRR